MEPNDACCSDDTERPELFSTIYGDDPGSEGVELVVPDNDEASIPE